MTAFPVTQPEFEQFCQRNALAVSVPTTPPRILCRILGGRPCYLLPEDLMLTPHLAMSGFWEAWISTFLITLVRPGWRWADIGANVGYYSLLFHDLTHGGQGYAWEPNPPIHECLRDTFNVNGCKATLYQAAFGPPPQVPHESGTTIFTLHASKRYTGGSSLYKTEYVQGDTSTTQVRLMTELPEVEVLKIDAEGHDLPIVLSLQNPPPHIILEYVTGYGHIAALTPAMFDKYEVQEIRGGGIVVPISPRELSLQEITSLYLKPK